MTRSQELFERAKAVIPGGVSSPVRAFKAVGGTPLFVARAEGARFQDEDGRSFVDYVGSWGPMILGHAHPDVLEAIRDAASRGTSFGAPCALEVELAERVVRHVPSVEKVRFVSSGTEATMSALRVARGFTSRRKILKFDGCYHGHADSPARLRRLRGRDPRHPGLAGRARGHGCRHPRRALQRRAGGRAGGVGARGRPRRDHRGAGLREHGHGRAEGGLPRGAARDHPRATARSSSSTRS